MDTSTLNGKTAQVLMECTKVCGQLNQLLLLFHEKKAQDPDRIHLQKVLRKFGTEIHRISEIVKNRSNLQMKRRLQRRIYGMNGIEINHQKNSRKSRNMGTGKTARMTTTKINQPEVISFDEFTSEMNANAVADVTKLTSYDDDVIQVVEYEETITTSCDDVITNEEFSIRNPPSNPPFDINS